MRNLKSQPFTLGDDLIAKGKARDDWLKEIEREFRYFKIMEPTIYDGKEIVQLEKSLPNLTDGGNDYKKLKKKLNDYFKPKKTKHHTRYIFFKMRPARDCSFQNGDLHSRSSFIQLTDEMLHTQVMKLISIITHTFQMHAFTSLFHTHTFSRSFHTSLCELNTCSFSKANNKETENKKKQFIS